MKESERLTNDLMERLISCLTPLGKEVFEEIESIGAALVCGEIGEEEADSRAEASLERMEDPRDLAILQRVILLKEWARDVAQDEAAREVERFRSYKALIERAQELERAQGKEPRQDMTLSEAIEVLRRHKRLD